MIDKQAMLSKALFSAFLLFLGGVGLSELEKLDFQKAIQSLQKSSESILSMNGNSEKGLNAFSEVFEKTEPKVMMKVSYESWTPQPVTKEELCRYYTDYEVCKEKEGKEE